MKKTISTAGISAGLWVLTAATFACGMMIGSVYAGNSTEAIAVLLLSFLASLAGSLPVFICLLLLLPVIRLSRSKPRIKLFFLLLLMLFTCMGYGLIAGIFNLRVVPYEYVIVNAFVSDVVVVTALLFVCSLSAVILRFQALVDYF